MRIKDGVAMFMFDERELLEEVYKKSSYQAKNLTNEAGDFIGDGFILSPDEMELFRSFLNNVDGRIGGYFVKNGESCFLCYCMNCCDDLRDIANKIDGCLKLMIVEGVLSEWYASCSHPDWAALFSQKFLAQEAILKRFLFQLSKKVRE